MTRIRNNEEGFTLVEVLVATLLMVMVIMALYALFDMSLRVYGIGNSEVETNEQARVAMERMEREIRNAECGTTCLISGSETEIKLDTKIASGTQTVLYYVCNDDHYGCGSDYEDNLMRMQDGDDPGEALAKIGSPTSGSPLTFEYCDTEYVCTDPLDPNPIDLNPGMVEITLEVEDNGRTQTLNTVAGLRNYEENP